MHNEGENYDRIAKNFAEMRDAFSTEKKYVDLLISHLSPKACILDVGCGSGYPIASYLIKHGFQVTGLDGSKELLKIAQKNCPSMELILGDIRLVTLVKQYEAIIEWWCLFHVPKQDHALMIARFAQWLKKDGILEFTTGDCDYEGKNSTMLDQELSFYSYAPHVYEKYLKDNGFKILLSESDQESHRVWIARYEG